MKNNFPNKKYSLIYSDPCWSWKDRKTGGKYTSGAEAKYKVMTVEEMCDLPVPSICEKNCFLAMWWVGSQPEEALTLMKAWGFKLKTMTGFTWQKTTRSGEDCFGMGHWTRQSTENCLFATKGRPERVNASIRNFISSPS